VIESWSDATNGEIRDDQGISLHNPDTDVFMKYTLAGAYDSNIALLLTVGNTRLATYQGMAETIRQTRMRGRDLATNLEFHYGLVNWFIAQNVNARPTTRFIVPYLTAVGELKRHANNVDLEYAYKSISTAALAGAEGEAAKALSEALMLKESLLLRPLHHLLQEPHVLSGWLSINRDCYTMIDGRISWNENPLELLADTYHFLNMDNENDQEDAAAAIIWDHDDRILQDAIAFYDELNNRLQAGDWVELCSLLDSDDAPAGMDDATWDRVRGAHLGFQAGVDVMAVLPSIAEATGFYDLRVNPDLTVHIPTRLNDPELQAAMAKVLVPPPLAKSDEILAESGGMFYARETPEHDVYVKEGDHFNAGDPLFIIEVMKMFNKYYAPFSGTIEKVLVEADGMIIHKGQPIFKISPDERPVIESPEEVAARRREATSRFLQQL
jgi:biotin carboxyl carrier protein